MKKWQEISIFIAFVVLVGFIMMDYVLDNTLKAEITSNAYVTGVVESRIENISSAFLVHNAQAGAVLHQGNNFTIRDIVLGDSESSVYYLFDVKNEGKLKSMLVSLSILNEESEDYEAYVTYADGISVSLGDVWDEGTTKTMRLTIQYKGEERGEIRIPILNLSMGFEQA